LLNKILRRRNMKTKKHRGITLIELIVTLAIVLIVTSAAFNFFIPSTKALNNVEINNNLQNEGENAINKISEYSMGASSIESINSSVFKEETFISATEINSITFNLFDFEEHEYKIEGNKLTLRKSGEVDGKTICNYVDKLIIEPIKNNEGKTYGIKINLILKLNNTSKNFQNRIYFRN
jgi:prepilin-type N-terminal cleavage/methylation domain-containing protein